MIQVMGNGLWEEDGWNRWSRKGMMTEVLPIT
jgi:hypothetical protein